MAQARERAQGFYVFLGRGDSSAGTENMRMTLEQWVEKIDFMRRSGLNTLVIFLGGYFYAYPSKEHPEIVEKDSVNATENFLPALIRHCHRSGIKVYLGLGTFGHQGAIWLDNPDLRAKDRRGDDVGFGILCPENDLVKRMVASISKEVFSLYEEADGVIYHPQEFYKPCYCDLSRKVIEHELGQNWKLSQYHRFLTRRYCEFMDELSSLRWLRNKKMLMFTCWFMDKNLDVLASRLPRDFTLVHWDYNKSAERRAFLARRLTLWSKVQDQFDLWFMPPGTLTLNPGASPDYYESLKLIDRSFYDPRTDLGSEVAEMIKAAKSAGVSSIVFFLGWTWESTRVRRSLVRGLRKEFPRSSR